MTKLVPGMGYCCTRPDHAACWRSKEDSAEGSPAQDVSEAKNISKWLRVLSCDVLAKNVATFCPCPKDLPEVKMSWERRFQDSLASTPSCGH